MFLKSLERVNKINQFLKFVIWGIYLHIKLKDLDEAIDLLLIADKYLFTELSDTCDSFLAQDCANKVQSPTKADFNSYLKKAVEGANMVRAPKWTAAIFQKRIEAAKHSMLRANLKKALQIRDSECTVSPEFIFFIPKGYH